MNTSSIINGGQPIKLISVNNLQMKYPFPHAFNHGENEDSPWPYTLVELNMMAVAGAIKDKPLWYEKIKNPEIIDKWREEIKSKTINGKVMHETQIEAIFQELEYYSSLSSKELSISPVDGVWLSDSIINEELHQQLIAQVALLEQNCHDWHPGSNNQMLDLVHPSLYPYVADITRELLIEPDYQSLLQLQEPILDTWQQTIIGNQSMKVNRILAKRIKNKYATHQVYNHSSENYQWLPSEVYINDNHQCKILSYINNLHPKDHKSLYHILENILQKFIPLFEIVLTGLLQPDPQRQIVPLSIYPNQDRNKKDYEDYDSDDEDIIPVIPQEVPSFHPPTVVDSLGNEQPHPKIDLKNTRLQVIFKLANIVLTPENPNYDGGSWHIEGMMNEHIVSSGIYYYHSENITESKLNFRTSVCTPEYQHNDRKGCEALYGLADEKALVQNLGSVTCLENRSICWPNTLQHQVQNFTLQDPSKPGIRKILVFFLIDPTQRILSTSIVPPQQQNWIKREYQEFLQLILFQKFPRHFSSIIQELILEYVEMGSFSHDLALEIRLKLMEERKYFIVQNNTDRFERPFSLCEH